MRDIHEGTSSLFNAYPSLLDDKSRDIAIHFEKYLNEKNFCDITYKCSKTHPISVYYKNKKIFGINRQSKKLNYDIVQRNLEKLKSLKPIDFNCDLMIYYDKHIEGDEKGFRMAPKKDTVEEVIEIFEKIINKLEIR